MKSPKWIAIAFVAFITGEASAETLYAEDFANQSGKGASGFGIDFSGVDWTIDLGASTNSLFDGSHMFQVLGTTSIGSPDAMRISKTKAGCSIMRVRNGPAGSTQLADVAIARH